MVGVSDWLIDWLSDILLVCRVVGITGMDRYYLMCAFFPPFQDLWRPSCRNRSEMHHRPPENSWKGRGDCRAVLWIGKARSHAGIFSFLWAGFFSPLSSLFQKSFHSSFNRFSQEELLKGLSNKSPKIVSGCTAVIRDALRWVFFLCGKKSASGFGSIHVEVRFFSVFFCRKFGSKYISIKILLKALPPLLSDRDKGVRDEAKALIVEIYRWIAEAIKPHLVSLQPVQVKIRFLSGTISVWNGSETNLVLSYFLKIGMWIFLWKKKMEDFFEDFSEGEKSFRVDLGLHGRFFLLQITELETEFEKYKGTKAVPEKLVRSEQAKAAKIAERTENLPEGSGMFSKFFFLLCK